MKDYCTNVFFSLQAFQWYIICNFWTYELKDMEFTSFNWNLIQISILNSVWFWCWHVVACDLLVPVHADHHRGALDLKRSGWIRSSSTPWVSDFFWSVWSRSDGRESKGEFSPRVRFSNEQFRWGLAGGGLQRGYSDFWTTAMTLWCSARGRDLDSLIEVVNHVLLREREAELGMAQVSFGWRRMRRSTAEQIK
jgi:hypothetical protein